MAETVKCAWTRTGGPLEYGGQDYSQRFEVLPKDIAIALQNIYGPNFLILWEEDTAIEGFNHPKPAPSVKFVHVVEEPKAKEVEFVTTITADVPVPVAKETKPKKANQKAAKAKE